MGRTPFPSKGFAVEHLDDDLNVGCVDPVVARAVGGRHEGAEAAIAKMRDISEKKRAAANKKWRPKGMQVHSGCNADAMLSNNQYPTSNSQRLPSLPTPSSVTAVGKDGLLPVSDVIRKFDERRNG